MARSIAVMDLMQHDAAIPNQRFLIGGSADNAPVSSNDTEQGRAHNRRVEIVVLDSVDAQHPAAVPPTTG
jgi:flagellar motor protein MotB